MKDVVFGVSVGGLVKQTRGVTWRAPNWTVSSTATSNDTIRPVILSRPEKTAVGFLILSACAALKPPISDATTRAARVHPSFIILSKPSSIWRLSSGRTWPHPLSVRQRDST